MASPAGTTHHSESLILAVLYFQVSICSTPMCPPGSCPSHCTCDDPSLFHLLMSSTDLVPVFDAYFTPLLACDSQASDFCLSYFLNAPPTLTDTHSSIPFLQGWPHSLVCPNTQPCPRFPKPHHTPLPATTTGPEQRLPPCQVQDSALNRER